MYIPDDCHMYMLCPSFSPFFFIDVYCKCDYMRTTTTTKKKQKKKNRQQVNHKLPSPITFEYTVLEFQFRSVKCTVLIRLRRNFGKL